MFEHNLRTVNHLHPCSTELSQKFAANASHFEILFFLVGRCGRRQQPVSKMYGIPSGALKCHWKMAPNHKPSNLASNRDGVVLNVYLKFNQLITDALFG